MFPHVGQIVKYVFESDHPAQPPYREVLPLLVTKVWDNEHVDGHLFLSSTAYKACSWLGARTTLLIERAPQIPEHAGRGPQPGEWF
jgi:hypothetical protein